MSVGRYIRKRRIANDLSLRELAKRCEISPSFLSDIENENRYPSEATIRKLAEHLVCDFYYLCWLNNIIPTEITSRLFTSWPNYERFINERIGILPCQH